MIRLTERGSKIGLHAQKTTFFDHLRQAAAQGTPFPVAKLTQEQTALADVKRDSPQTLTVCRVPHQLDGLQGIADEPRMSDARAREWAGVVMGHAFRYLELNPTLVPHIDVFELVNEPDPATIDGWYNFGLVMRECVRLGRSRYPSVAWGVGSFNAGTPEIAEMQAFIMSGILDEGAHGDVVLCVHEGVLDPAAPIDSGHGQLIPGATAVPAGGGALFGRVAYFAQLAGDKMLPVIVSEAYMQAYGDTTEIRRRAEWVDALYAQLWYVVAWLPFTHSPTDPWKNQDYTGAYPSLLEYAGAVRDRQNATKPVEEPPPPEPTLNAVMWQAGKDEERINFPREGALKNAIAADGYWPTSNEFDRQVAGVVYRGQKARHPQTRADRVYMARFGEWGNVWWIEEPEALPQINLTVPLTGPFVVTSRFNDPRDYDGDRVKDDKHEGWDFAPKASGSLCVAPADGVVDTIGFNDKGYGHYVRLRHDFGGLTAHTWLGHMAARPEVNLGQNVKRGQRLGLVGSSGNSTGAHVHLTLVIPGHGLDGYVIDDVVDPGPFLDLTPIEPAAPIIGVDVSHWQGAINWQTTRAQGVRFAFVKVSEGSNSTDPRGAANIAGARAAGVYVGPYHFYRNWVDPIAQANHFVSRIPAGCNLPPAVDVEDPNGAPSDIANRLQQFMGRVAALTGVLPQVIYTRANYWNSTIGSAPWPAVHYLWVAHYTSLSQPSIPTVWNKWTIWQYTSDGNGQRYGATSPRIDLNRFNGTLADLEAMTVTYRPAEPSIDMAPYFLPRQGDYGDIVILKNNWGAGDERQQLQRSGNTSYVTKNQQYEKRTIGQDVIRLEIDTSPGNNTYYTVTSPTGWMPRNWRPGATFTRSETARFYRKGDCVATGQVLSGSSDLRFAQLHAHYTTRGGLTFRDVAEVHWIRNGAVEEKYFYSVGYGLIAWWNKGGRESWAVEVIPVGQQSNNVREQGCYS